MPIDPLLREAIALFVIEAGERAEAITRCVLELEKAAPGSDVIVKAWARVARELHTLKGTAATSGLADLASVAHEMETLIGPLQKKAQPIPPGLADAVLKACDAFVVRARAYSEGTDDDAPFPSTVLDALRAPPARADGPRTGSRPATGRDDDTRSSRSSGSSGTGSSGTGSPGTGSSGSSGTGSSGTGSSATGSSGTGAPGTVDASADASAPGSESPRASSGAAGPASADESDSDESGAWRVRSEDVLAFGREVERLRELRLRLDDRMRDLDAAVDAATQGLPAERAIALRVALAHVRRGLALDSEESGDVVQSLEDGVKTICTLPVRTMLDPLHRVVRDLCRASGKKATLAVVGGDVAIDRRLLESLRGPLIQLVRNAVDHGVEAPSARTAKGKHDTAAIAVRVEQHGNMLFVEVADDGGGLQTEDIRAAALRANVIGAAEASTLAVDEVHRLVFRHGLSTQRSVSETSGRGVGLDLVHNQVRALQGHIDVVSTPGHGARFLMHVPVELGASSVLIVRCGDHHLGIPMLAVEATIAARSSALRVSRRSSAVEHRDALLPLVDLGALLGVRADTPPEEGAPLLVFASEARRCALIVDEVIGDRELVVRPLPPELATRDAYQGAAVMAKGDLVLVLRPDWLARHDGSDAEARGEGGSGGQRVLVVDDSLTARALHRTILEAGGFTVHAAASVTQAEEQLRRGAYDVVVCDLTFAAGERDGLALLQSVRSSPRTRAVIFVMVSMSHDADARRRARELGADAWLTKEECASGRLLGEVAALSARGRTG